MDNLSLKIEINSLPDDLQREVVDFVSFLKKKATTRSRLKHRQFGFAKGKIKLSSDFDKPLDIFENCA
jgi:hypothetical protein